MISSDRERQAPLVVEEAEPSHLARYQFAANFITEISNVLDVPCGSGYGSALLGRHARHVLGVDIHVGAIEHANECFSCENVEFAALDAHSLSRVTDAKSCFDTVISFEGVEHMLDPSGFIAETKKVLVPGGMLIISTPRKPHGSPYHTVEFSLEEFVELLNVDFNIVALFGQIFVDIFDMANRSADPAAFERFNFIALCQAR